MTTLAVSRPQPQPPVQTMPDESAIIPEADRDAQYITFAVGAEEYGINILAVREIRGWTPVNRLPNMPDDVCGVMTLRGLIIPIFDLRSRFGGGRSEPTGRHVVVVLQTDDQVRGILVDAISDILTVKAERIQPPPTLEASHAGHDYLSGLYGIEGRMVSVLNVGKLFNRN